MRHVWGFLPGYIIQDSQLPYFGELMVCFTVYTLNLDLGGNMVVTTFSFASEIVSCLCGQ